MIDLFLYRSSTLGMPHKNRRKLEDVDQNLDLTPKNASFFLRLTFFCSSLSHFLYFYLAFNAVFVEFRNYI